MERNTKRDGKLVEAEITPTPQRNPKPAKPLSRHIPENKQRDALQKTNGLCIHCNNPATVIHHRTPTHFTLFTII